jgi:two-component system chemotaxis response regulator CheY
MSQLRILIVDDDPLNLNLAEVILKGAGHETSAAYNGAEALAQAIDQGRQFDLILMDYNMPIMDGLTAVRALRAHPSTRALPILMVSGSTSGLERQQADRAGVNGFLPKPYRRQTLLDAVAAALDGR